MKKITIILFSTVMALSLDAKVLEKKSEKQPQPTTVKKQPSTKKQPAVVQRVQPKPQDRAYEIPVNCFYELHPWAEQVLFPTMMEFNRYLGEMRQQDRRADHARMVNLYNGYAKKIETGLKRLKQSSITRSQYITPQSQQELDKIFATMKKIVAFLYGIKKPIGPLEIRELNELIHQYHAEYNIIQEAIQFLKQNKIEQSQATIPVPKNFKGYINVQPYCNAALAPQLQVNINPTATTYTREGPAVIPVGPTV